MKILIIGGGQLSIVINKQLKEKYEISVLDKKINNIDEFIKTNSEKILNTDIIINTIAVSDTRKCEKEWENTFKINVELPIKINLLIKDIPKIKFIFISTGCIFDGNNIPHYENSTPTPHIAYSQQKLISESFRFIRSNYIIIRPRMIFSDINIKSNLLKKINSFDSLIDELNSMTCAYDIAKFIDIICERNLKGIFNFCNKNLISPKDIKILINKIHNIYSPIWSISKKELHKKVGLKLTDTWIESNNINDYYDMPDIKVRLSEMIKKSSWLLDNINANNTKQ